MSAAKVRKKTWRRQPGRQHNDDDDDNNNRNRETHLGRLKVSTHKAPGDTLDEGRGLAMGVVRLTCNQGEARDEAAQTSNKCSCVCVCAQRLRVGARNKLTKSAIAMTN